MATPEDASDSTHTHDFILLTKTWQTVNALRYQVLSHSEQIAVCVCGFVVNPWKENNGR